MKGYLRRLYKKSKKEYYIQLSKYLDTRTRKMVVTANPETLMMAEYNWALRDILMNEENDIVPDGIAVVKMARFCGFKVKERITGIDMCTEILKLLNQKKRTLYLFGASEEVINKLVENIKKEYPCIKILGYENGYVEDKDAVMDKIIEANPDACLVALGIPLQEELIARHIEDARRGVYLGVGGSFDVLSGVKKRAPKWMINCGLEWLYRLIKEPKRLGRFFKNNVKFVFEVIFHRK